MPQSKNADHIVSLTLRLGAYGALVLIVCGMLLQVAFPGVGSQIMRAGVVLLLATPVMRIIVVLVLFLRENDRRYALVSFVVLLIVLFSSWFGIGGH